MAHSVSVRRWRFTPSRSMRFVAGEVDLGPEPASARVVEASVVVGLEESLVGLVDPADGEEALAEMEIAPAVPDRELGSVLDLAPLLQVLHGRLVATRSALER